MLDGIADYIQVWPSHGAGSAYGKALGAVPSSTIGYEKRFNPAILAASDEQGFVDFILTGQPEPPLYFANMKRDNKVGPPVLGGVPQPPRIDAAQLRALDGRRVAIADTRPWEAFRMGHVRNSLSLPLRQTFNTDAGSLIRDDEDIVLIVDPSRLDEAVRDLIRIGLDRIRGWFDANDLDQYETSDTPLVTIAEITAEEAPAMMVSDRVQVLDVRRATEFAGGHMPNAINVAHTRLAARLDEVPKDRHLLVNCRTGARSARACSYLQRLGYEVANLKGGILAWDLVHVGADR
ncbi:MAG: MBL fold metallo-hydrolase, partial [Planctomycetes bacterium]|nr:MBL fold metallo-hydrolase [Planctomycetota bacterium]